LSIAVGAPASTIKEDHQWPLAQKVLRAPQHSITIAEFKRRRRIASFQRLLTRSGVRELLDFPINNLKALGWNKSVQLGSEFFELLGQRHV
jgi:hypothetical protein